MEVSQLRRLFLLFISWPRTIINRAAMRIKEKIMSEYTIIYLRNKAIPMLEYKEELSWNEIKDLPEDERERLYRERREYNENVHKSFGCELFYLCTTPSRQLTALPWTENPRPFTKELLEDVLAFYKEKIDDYKKYITQYKETIARLETRIARANVELYDKISNEMDGCNESISECESDLEDYQFFYNKFEFLKGIMDEESNAENYELIYTKC